MKSSGGSGQSSDTRPEHRQGAHVADGEERID